MARRPDRNLLSRASDGMGRDRRTAGDRASNGQQQAINAASQKQSAPVGSSFETEELPADARTQSSPSLAERRKAIRRAGKTGPAVSRLPTQDLRSGASPSQCGNNKTLLRTRRVLLVPIAPEPVRRLGLGYASGATPMRAKPL